MTATYSPDLTGEFVYSVYGLRIRSSVVLPHLTRLNSCDEALVDVTVRLVTQKPPLNSGADHNNPGVEPSGTERNSVTLHWDGVGHFYVREGREVLVFPRDDLDEELLSLFLLGPVLATLLHQRGLLVLHASAVLVNGAAVVFLGGSGWGKSTLAASFYNQGYTLVADDLVAVQCGNNNPQVLPSFPQMKLWPESAAAVGDDVAALPQLHPETEKRARRLQERYATQSAPLACIFLLGWGERLETRRLAPRDALRELMAHSYCAPLIEGADAATHFRQCAEVASIVPLHQLIRVEDLQQLNDVIQLVQRQVTCFKSV